MNIDFLTDMGNIMRPNCQPSIRRINNINMRTSQPHQSIQIVKSIEQENIKQGDKPLNILLCAIGKMENHYIREWVEWYKDLDFDNICLYDNNNEDGEHFEDTIKDYIDSGFVILKNKRGLKCQQIPCYNECFNEYKNTYKWIAFFDIDEFLEIDRNKFKNIGEYLGQDKFVKFSCIRVCWKNFDDNGLIKVENNNYSVSRFTHANNLDPQSKSILKTYVSGRFPTDNPHILRGNVTACNSVGIPCNNSNGIRGKVSLEDAYLKHYRFKTIEEYVLNKMVKLWPTNYKNGGKDILNLDMFFDFNKKTDEKVNYANLLLNKPKLVKEKTSQIIVSLTSYKERLKYIPQVINSILNNTLKPNKICLTLYKDDIQYINEELQDYITKNNIEIITCNEDLKCHNKYFYVMQKYPNECIITIDDDVIYSSILIQSLYQSYTKFPNCVIGGRCHYINRDKEGNTLNYGEWKYECKKYINTPKEDLFATGIGGILYPPNILQLSNKDLETIKQCITTDDIWLHWKEKQLGVKTVLSIYSFHINHIKEADDSPKSLWKQNSLGDKNNDKILKIFKL